MVSEMTVACSEGLVQQPGDNATTTERSPVEHPQSPVLSVVESTPPQSIWALEGEAYADAADYLRELSLRLPDESDGRQKLETLSDRLGLLSQGRGASRPACRRGRPQSV